MSEDLDTRFADLTGLMPLVGDLLHNSRRKLDILSGQLDPRIYAQGDVLDAIAALAVGSRQAQVRILLHQPPSGGHQLIELQRRLSSKILLRVMQPLSHHAGHSFMCGDDKAVVFFNNEAQFEGFYHADARAQAKRLTADFDLYWQVYSREEADLRRLYI